MKIRISRYEDELYRDCRRRGADVTEIDRFIYRIEVMLHDEQSRGEGRRTGARISCAGQFYAAALEATAFFADLGNGGEVNMQRQGKNEQQRRNTDDASKHVRFGGQRRQHRKNLAQLNYRCQRAPKLRGSSATCRMRPIAVGFHSPSEPTHPSAAAFGADRDS